MSRTQDWSLPHETDAATALAARVGARIAPLSRDGLVEQLLAFLDRPGSDTAYGIHVANLNQALGSTEYRGALARASLCYCDGLSAKVAAAAFGLHVPERIVTTDLIWPVLQAAADKRRSVFLVGGPEGLAEAAAAVAMRRCNGLRLAGCASGYFDDRSAPIIADRIRATSPDLVLVAMGVPREQFFCDRYGAATGATLLMTGGGLFGFMAGLEARAPRSVRRRGFEWAWRLVHDPGRLLPRYATGVVTTFRLMVAGLRARTSQERTV